MMRIIKPLYASIRRTLAGHRLGRLPGVRRLDRWVRQMAASGESGEFHVAGKKFALHPEVVMGRWTPLGDHILHEPLTTERFVDAIRPSSTVVDVGAQYGYFSVIASGFVGTGGKVLAFEPDPRPWPFLEWAAQHSRGNLEISQMAVSSGQGHGQLSVSGTMGSSSLVPGMVTDVQSVREVEMIALDDVFDQRPELPAPSVVKIDVEGAELAVLRGMERLLEGDVTLIIEYERTHIERHPELHDLPRWLEDRGFRLTVLDEREGIVRDYATGDEPPARGNLLAVRR